MRFNPFSAHHLLSSIPLCSLWFIVFLFAACMPAETPAVLINTPGAPITLDGERYTNSAFSVAIPRGWQVITSPAEAPPAVTFAAPDGCTVLHLSTVPADPPIAPNCDQAVEPFTQTLTLGEQTLVLVGSAPADADSTLRAAADLITESLSPR